MVAPFGIRLRQARSHAATRLGSAVPRFAAAETGPGRQALGLIRASTECDSVRSVLSVTTDERGMRGVRAVANNHGHSKSAVLTGLRVRLPSPALRGVVGVSRYTASHG